MTGKIEKVLERFGFKIVVAEQMVVRDSLGRVRERYPVQKRDNGSIIYDASMVDTGLSQVLETRKTLVRI